MHKLSGPRPPLPPVPTLPWSPPAKGICSMPMGHRPGPANPPFYEHGRGRAVREASARLIIVISSSRAPQSPSNPNPHQNKSVTVMPIPGVVFLMETKTGPLGEEPFVVHNPGQAGSNAPGCLGGGTPDTHRKAVSPTPQQGVF